MKGGEWGRSLAFIPDSLEGMGCGGGKWGRERERIGREGRGTPLEARGMRLAERFWRAKRSLKTESKETRAGLTGLLRLDAGSPVFFYRFRSRRSGKRFTSPAPLDRTPPTGDRGSPAR